MNCSSTAFGISGLPASYLSPSVCLGFCVNSFTISQMEFQGQMGEVTGHRCCVALSLQQHTLPPKQWQKNIWVWVPGMIHPSYHGTLGNMVQNWPDFLVICTFIPAYPVLHFFTPCFIKILLILVILFIAKTFVPWTCYRRHCWSCPPAAYTALSIQTMQPTLKWNSGHASVEVGRPFLWDTGCRLPWGPP